VLQAASVVKAIGMGFAMLRVGEEGQPEVLSAFLPQLKEVRANSCAYEHHMNAIFVRLSVK
jgi:hypothetical protein